MPIAPLAHPLYVMPKPVGSSCNLVCDYCYYLEKHHLYGQSPSQLMSDATLETFIRQYIESQTQPDVLFTWHGGEPLLRPIDFYERAVSLQRRYARGRTIDNCIQTNGTLLTDEWCRFLKANNWLVGISIDGPQPFHDAYRRAHGGKPSFERVIHGINLLQKHGVEWNVMGVVNAVNGDHPLEVYRFYKSLGAKFIQFTPIVERLQSHPDGRHLAAPTSVLPSGGGDFATPTSTLPFEVNDLAASSYSVSSAVPLTGSQHQSESASRMAPFSVTPEQYASFLTSVFDEWLLHDVGEVFVQLFDSTLACWVGEPPGLCTMAPTCGHALAMEHNGDLYSCDHFVFPEFRLGNIHETPLTTLAYSSRQLAFGRAKRDNLPAQCLACQWLFACNGGCPKDRFLPPPAQPTPSHSPSSSSSSSSSPSPDSLSTASRPSSISLSPPPFPSRESSHPVAEGSVFGGISADTPSLPTLAPSPSTPSTSLNYLCPAYRAFFAHVAPAMDFMANELRHQRPPANVMQWASSQAR